MKQCFGSFGFRSPSMTGSLDTYIQAVNRFALPDPGGRKRLIARRLRDHEDVEGRAPSWSFRTCVLVVSIARGYLGYGLPHFPTSFQEGKRRLDEGGEALRSGTVAYAWFRSAVHWIRAGDPRVSS